MVSNALPRMHYALVGAKRLECGSLLPLCSNAQTTCLSPYSDSSKGRAVVAALLAAREADTEELSEFAA
ncbi:MAG: hypothetical protein GX456_15950 [Verrucomicrobia bacterium]|nr:hypothetical protein [Verrucomicrobiota bacterium]